MSSAPAEPTVTFLPSQKRLKCAPGARLYDVILAAQLPLGSSCDGDSMCGWCLVQIIAGAEGLSAPKASELRLLKRRDAEENERIACETQIYGSITVKTTYW